MHHGQMAAKPAVSVTPGMAQRALRPEINMHRMHDPLEQLKEEPQRPQTQAGLIAKKQHLNKCDQFESGAPTGDIQFELANKKWQN